jgi:adhesin transport system membrane fusion protein
LRSFSFLLWAYLTEIEEITKGQGKVVPFNQNQVVQNLEGGIVEDILVRQGEKVTKGQLLARIQNVKSESSFEEKQLKMNALKAKAARLYFEANDLPFNPPQALLDEIPTQLKDEENLYYSDIERLEGELQVTQDQLQQRYAELREAESKYKHLRQSYKLMREEVAVAEPLVRQGLQSRVDFLKLKREANSMLEQKEAARLAIPKIQSTIKEVKNKLRQSRTEFRNKAAKEWNQVSAELEQLESSSIALKDQVQRTEVLSPVDGIILKNHINTIGGVIKPGADIFEIVPTQDKLLIETKIKPSDIAFLYPDQRAMIKFSAYDFAIYGGMEGHLTKISADTDTDKKGNSFYIVYVQADKMVFSKTTQSLDIIPGMTASIDIVTGKKSILDYILKPILKSKQYALSER